MSDTLGTRALTNSWDTPVTPRTLSPGQGDVIAYSKRFSASSNGSDTSANVNCFGRVQAAVYNSNPGANPTSLTVYVIAIGSANVSQNKNLAEALLNTGAQNGDPFDLNVPPTGCANRRATGVYETFTWRIDPITLDATALPGSGTRFRMALGEINTQSCPAGQQPADLVLRPGYVRPDTIGNYMTDYRIALRLINTDPDIPRTVDVKFGRTGSPIGLAWQIDTGPDAASDAEVDALPTRTGWAGTNEPVLDRSFLESDGGPVFLGPCEERTVSLRFLILGNSSLPFEISLHPSLSSEYIVDNAQSSFYPFGDWAVSGNAGFYASNSLVTAGGTGADRCVAVPALGASGRYDVYAWWVASGNRATAAPYDVRHLLGTTRITKNQTTAGGAWNLLGTFDFAKGPGGRVVLTDAVPPSQFVSADAFRLVYAAPIEAIVDNRSAQCTFVGVWPASANAGFWGTDSQYHAGDGGASTVTFRPALPYNGRYRVSAWWVTSGNRATAAPYTIHHLGGSATVTVNQTDAATGNQWNLLGTFDFHAGTAGSVVLAANVPAAQLVSADAVRFELLDIADIAADLDQDGQADADDQRVLAECVGGPGTLAPPFGCVPMDFDTSDLDADGDVDLADHAFMAASIPAP